MTLFGSPYGALTVWIHGLAFDLFIGAWAARDARRHQIHHAWVVLTMMGLFAYGPLGLLFYFLVRVGSHKTTSLDECRIGRRLSE
jgi:hypothetical protein